MLCGLLMLACLQNPDPPEGDIAFMRNGHVWLYHIESKQAEDLAESGFDRPITWSPDGSRILFWLENATWNVWEVDVATSDVRNLTDQIGWDCRSASYSPDGHRVAFLSGVKGLCVMGAGGSGIRILTALGHRDQVPAWSPDGSTLIFCHDKGGETLYSIPSTGGKPQPIGPGHDAACSRDGLLSFAAQHGPTMEIFVSALDGSGRKPLTNTSDLQETKPVWSPNGQRIAYRRVGTDDEELCVINRDGTGLKVLATIKGDGYHGHTWSPKGDWLAYTGGDRGEETLYLVSAEGGEPKAVQFDGVTWPAWRPKPTPSAEPPATRS